MKDIRKQELIKNILTSNLNTQDKQELVQFLNKDGISMNDFVQHVITLLKIGKNTLKLFDIDLGDE